jgi:putative ABC transport system permease protein
VLAIELAGDAAAGSFRSSLETLTGRADFELTATGGIAPDVLGKLAAMPEPLTLRPRIEDYALVKGGRTVPFLGIDVLSDIDVEDRPDAATRTESPDFTQTDTIWAGRKLGWKIGERTEMLLNDRDTSATVRGLLPESAGEVIVTDLAQAARLLGRPNGALDRILVEIPQGADADRYEHLLQQTVGTEVTVSRFGARTDENRRMLTAFRWNLRVLSWIALVVGAFLIYNTISVSVVRRRAEIGVLRALGATRGGVLAAFLGEAALFGLAGGAAGVLLGRLLAQSAVGLVAMTVQSLYVSSRPGDIALTPFIAIAGVAVGLAVAVASALLPAWEAAQITPVEAMSRGRAEHKTRTRTGPSLLVAAALGLIAALASQQPPVAGKPVFGYLAALALIGMLAAGIAPVVNFLSGVTAGAMRAVFGVEGLLATRSLRGSLRRTSVLAGALATAIAMTAAVGIMVGSFRQTVLLWMDDRLKADLYLSPAAPGGADRHPTLTADTIEHLRSLPEVAAVDPFRAYRITYNGKPATFGGGDAHLNNRWNSALADRLARDPHAAVVSEPFASKHNVRRGDRITVHLGAQDVRFEVVDIYTDYASEQGYIIVDRATLLRWLPDPAPSNMAVYLKPGVDLETGRDAVAGALSGRRVNILSNRTLREGAIRTFDRTFAITWALEGVAVFVAVMGVAGALLALVIDRRREFGLLRFLGGATAQIRRLILFEAGLLGLLANLVGLGIGVLLSLLLIFVINKQSFGWTIQFHWPVAMLLGALTAVFLATVAAAVYPARVAARLNPIEVIHEE